MTDQIWIVDTNFVYEGLQETMGQYKIALISTVKQELDKHKTASDRDLQWQARVANRFIFENYDTFLHITAEYDSEQVLGKAYSNEVKDNKIVACAVANGYGILTNDLNMFSTAKDFGIEVKSFNEKEESYTLKKYKGFTEVRVTSEELIRFNVESLGKNKYNLLINEYLILVDDLGNHEAFIWNGSYHESINPRLVFNSKYLGQYKPKDIYQLITMDSIIRNPFTMINGVAGVGKTLGALSYAIQELEAGSNYNKIVFITNNMPAKDAFYNGLVKGSLIEKLLSSSIGNMLGSKLGGKEQVLNMVMEGRLEIIPLSDVRGWEPQPNSIVLISEGQNFSREGMKLAIQRIPDTCKLIVEGDVLTQVDSKMFEGRNNGMLIASEVFRGTEYFGQVELQNVYRSDMAKRAELMSEWK